MLEELEKEHISLLRERADMITKRRREDDEDDLSTFLGPLLSPRLMETDGLDELGRTVPQPDLAKEQRDRRVARAERRQHRSSRRSRDAGGEEDGYSTDSSLATADFDAYVTALQSLTSRKKEVLADVRAEEFRDPGKGKWRIWREKYPDSYVGAWGGLGVVSTWDFWMRLESVGWDCIEVCPRFSPIS
jgi:GC-rich sequence DNA-binding factor